MIKVENVSKYYGKLPAVSQISFQAQDREILVLLGTSGCGKTTTLKMINRLIEPTKGEIYINGENIKARKAEELRMNIGFVMQHAGLFPHYTIAENIAIVPQLLKWDKKKIQHRTQDLLEKLHLSHDVLSRFPNELSGGQQQRVGIARALITDTPVLLMDEPFGALDTITKTDIHAEFKSLEEIKNKTIILVTHDVQEAFDLGHKICLMDKGKIIQSATPKEILYHPKNEFVKNFFDDNRLLLEYRIATLKQIYPYVQGDLHHDFPKTSSVWEILQILSSKREDELYERVMMGFNQYRKTQFL